MRPATLRGSLQPWPRGAGVRTPAPFLLAGVLAYVLAYVLTDVLADLWAELLAEAPPGYAPTRGAERQYPAEDPFPDSTF